ncbi:hypothetical protein KP2269_51630 [Klebsiella pneumoniae]|nr:hypothetical protein KP2269_51630 [Klebsiella pneumoniae]
MHARQHASRMDRPSKEGEQLGELEDTARQMALVFSLSITYPNPRDRTLTRITSCN